jgi:hypothetical protein
MHPAPTHHRRRTSGYRPLHLVVGLTALLAAAPACTQRDLYGTGNNNNPLTGAVCPEIASCPVDASGTTCCERQDGSCTWESSCSSGGGGNDAGVIDAFTIDAGAPDAIAVACTDNDCGPAPPIAPCTTGNRGPITCEPDAAGQCHWNVPPCPGGGCSYNGMTYSPGDSFPATDGCNNCSCQADGSVACTLRACAQLQYYKTCGDPSCHGATDDPTVPNCTSDMVAGQACDTDGFECELLDACNTRLVCTSSDPTAGPGGCPISRAEYKNNIQYLSPKDLEKVANEVQSINLATYRYNANVNPRATGGDPDAQHLGFIIDDVGQSACVNPDGHSVNLYGYTSMAVAALQVQAKQIAELKAELTQLKAALKPSRKPAR